MTLEQNSVVQALNDHVLMTLKQNMALSFIQTCFDAFETKYDVV